MRALDSRPDLPTPELRLSLALAAMPMMLAAGYALQPPGRYDVESLVARDGEPWLALRKTGTQSALVAAIIHLTPPEHDDEATVIAYLRGPLLVAGRLRTGFVGTPRLDTEYRDRRGAALVSGYRFDFNGDAYQVGLTCRTRRDSERHFLGKDVCDVVLAGPEGRKQVVDTISARLDAQGYPHDLGLSANPTLLFAGDLDGDSRLDLIVDLTTHFQFASPTLMLSSEAADREMVGTAATFEFFCC